MTELAATFAFESTETGVSMGDAIVPGAVLPNPRIPKVIGILNIVFGSALVLGGLCLGAYAAMLPMLGKAMTEMQKKAEASQEAQKQAELKAIEDAAKAATTDEEKRDLEAQRLAIEARPRPSPHWRRTSHC
jgi:H+/gluconate symporter-like permease